MSLLVIQNDFSLKGGRGARNPIEKIRFSGKPEGRHGGKKEKDVA